MMLKVSKKRPRQADACQIEGDAHDAGDDQWVLHNLAHQPLTVEFSISIDNENRDRGDVQQWHEHGNRDGGVSHALIAIERADDRQGDKAMPAGRALIKARE